MNAEAEIDFTATTLSAVIRHEFRRLQTGMALREAMHAHLEKGVTPDHYRMKWLEASIREAIALLRDIGLRFNEAHPNDKCSTSDFLDILHSAAKRIG